MNVSQYSLLAVIPIVILNKGVQYYVPEADEDKNSLEIIIEVVLQILVIMIGLLFIHRIVTSVPTMSKESYQDVNYTTLILAILVIVLSLQTKLGDKISILSSRVSNLWNGNNTTKEKKKHNKIKVSQPISQPTQSQQPNQQAMQQSLDNYSTSIDSLPTQSSPNFNQMYQNTPTPLVNAQFPAQENFESQIMAANEVLGGSFGSNF
jgi:DNA-binding protein Fis